MLFAFQDTTETGTGSGASLLVYMVLFGAVAYFFMIRPQRNRVRQQRMLADRLEVGDQVRTVGGLLGVVIGVEPDAILLGIDEGRIRVAKGAVASRIEAESDTSAEPTDD